MCVFLCFLVLFRFVRMNVRIHDYHMYCILSLVKVGFFCSTAPAHITMTDVPMRRLS